MIRYDIIETSKCTGTYFETGDKSSNGKDRPPPGTPCAGSCIEEGGRWGDNFCNTVDGNWGAECMDCKGKNLHFHSRQAVFRCKICIFSAYGPLF